MYFSNTAFSSASLYLVRIRCRAVQTNPGVFAALSWNSSWLAICSTVQLRLSAWTIIPSSVRAPRTIRVPSAVSICMFPEM